jgi:hypothetical protein
MKAFSTTVFLIASFSAWGIDQPYSPYNQQYTFNQNQQYGSTNWYSSALGMGVAQAGVTLIGGLVNAMSRPDPVVYMQPQQAPVVIQTPDASREANMAPGANPGSCSMQTLYDQQGNPRYVKVCD